MRLAPDVLADRVPDDLALHRHDGASVRVDLGGRFHAPAHELAHVPPGDFRHRRGHHFAGSPVADADHRGLATRAAPDVQPLAGVLVAFLAADERLVDLDRAGEDALVILERLVDAVAQVPGGLLRDPEVAPELHAGDALDAGRHQVDGERPLAEPEIRGLHDGSGLDREILPARPAPEWLRLARRARLHVVGIAARAPDAVRPADRDDPLLSGLIGRKHGRQIHQAEALSEALSRSARHRPVSPVSRYALTTYIIISGCYPAHKGKIVCNSHSRRLARRTSLPEHSLAWLWQRCSRWQWRRRDGASSRPVQNLRPHARGARWLHLRARRYRNPRADARSLDR